MTSLHLPHSVALISETPYVLAPELATVAAALQKQVLRDFGPVWGAHATVAAFASRASAPAGYWPIIVRDALDEPGALGYHTDEHKQPVAYVQAGADWSVTASHELLEMLADPFGNRTWVATGPTALERVHYLIEVCDPPEAISYSIDGVNVSDFVLPQWYHTVSKPAHACTFAASIWTPRTIIKGGYVSYRRNSSGEWFQQTWFGANPVTTLLGRTEEFLDGCNTLREASDKHARSEMLRAE